MSDNSSRIQNDEMDWLCNARNVFRRVFGGGITEGAGL
jgi:hypothetical protein